MNTLPGLEDPAPAAQTKPTLSALIDSGATGLKVRNPDNGLEFRVVFVEVYGVCGVKIYEPCSKKRASKNPIMNRDEIETWLSGLITA